MADRFPIYKQLDTKDCGPTCLRIIARYYGKDYPLALLREFCNIGKEGVSLLGISNAAEKIGFNSIALKVTFDILKDNITLPCIVHWKQNHFVVVYKITDKYVYVADPGTTKQKLKKEEFLKNWVSTKTQDQPVGVVLALDVLPEFYEKTFDVRKENETRRGFNYLIKHLAKYKLLLAQLLIGVLFSTILQLIFPFLTQSIVDTGIANKDLNFVYLVLVGQIIIFLGETMVGVIQNWLLLYLGTRVNVAMISEFLMKLMKKPIKFFDTKNSGDLLQRIEDHKRIEEFLTSGTLRLVFSLFTLVVFAGLLLYYSLSIFLTFFTGGFIFVLWIFFFQNKRKVLDYKRFTELSHNKSKLVELINGMQEIKLQNAEKQKRWDWQSIQARLFRINIQYLSLEQFQRGGADFINTSKNIIITFMAARLVIENSMTLGEMMAIQYIVGQLNVPLATSVDFIHSFQDARISIERVGEIQEASPEEETDPLMIQASRAAMQSESIHIENLSFRYEGTHYFNVLKNLNLHIPKGKVTAIVGRSGSGKTTLLKLLLKFYEPTTGVIKIDQENLTRIDEKIWRSKCGAVLQDGFIFSDTIANNIAVGADSIDKTSLLHAVETANIREFIESLPLGYNTKIGVDGMGLSQGQKQRILIARAVYKDPEYIFFDEATNALDAMNERTIIDNLDRFFKNKTVIVVAHRLSTVKNADQIIVLENGELVESGTHRQLVDHAGNYFSLVKNQLELGT